MNETTAPTRPAATIEDTPAGAIARHEPEIEPERPQPTRRPQLVPAEERPRPVFEPAIFRQSDGEIGALYGALAEAQAAFDPVLATLEADVRMKAGGSYKYAYAPLVEVLRAVRPKLAEAGIAVMQFPFTRQGSVLVRTRLGHKSGQWLENELAVAAVSVAPQDIGSAITYARRYALMSILGVAPDDDDDGAGAPAQQEPPRAAPRRSEYAEPAAEAAPVLAPQGRIAELSEQGGGAIVKLDSGFVAASRNAEIIRALRAYESTKARVELLTRPSSNPARYAPIIEEVALLNGSTRA